MRDAATGGIIADMSSDEPVVICKGGKGGFGNSHFATPTRQIPRFAKTGTRGESIDALLELKLIADVGLLGFPNVGKSTLLSVVSAARPKIANYHFTTLEPMLGVVRCPDGGSFVMADIPGLIEGASRGIGLGFEFLRHIERCRMFVHVVDVSGSEGRVPADDFEAINAEIAAFNPKLAERPQIVVGNKSDAAENSELEAELKARAEARGYHYIPISAVTHQNIDELVSAVSALLKTLPEPEKFVPNYVKPMPEIGRTFTVERIDDDTFDIQAPWLERILAQSNVEDYESLLYFQTALLDSGIIDELVKQGAKEGDTVCVGEYQFDYVV